VHEQTPASRRALRAQDSSPRAAISGDFGPALSTTGELGPALELPDATSPALRSGEAEQGGAVADAAVSEPPASEVPSGEARAIPLPVALGALLWVDPDEAGAPRPTPTFVVSGATSRSVDLLAGARRSVLRPGTIIPTLLSC